MYDIFINIHSSFMHILLLYVHINYDFAAAFRSLYLSIEILPQTSWACLPLFYIER
jgi:hypothetical protein